MRIARRVFAVGVATTFVLASCGGSDGDDESLDTVVPTTEAESEPTEDFTPAAGEDDAPLDTTSPDEEGTDEAPGTTSSAVDSTTATTQAAPTDGGEVATSGAVEASMVEWAIDAPTAYTAGDVTFTATNNGNFPHEFVVIQGDGYDSLPLADGGAVIEDELPPDALIDRTDRIGGGASAELTVTLEAGNYVLLCNLGGGSNSHAGQGQTLDITVS